LIASSFSPLWQASSVINYVSEYIARSSRAMTAVEEIFDQQ